jgi:hypothetical protein
MPETTNGTKHNIRSIFPTHMLLHCKRLIITTNSKTGQYTIIKLPALVLFALWGHCQLKEGQMV